MASRLLGGKSVNAIGLGCMSLSWGYGPSLDDESAGRLLNLALDLGYDHLDTARIYGLGENERVIGQYLSGRRKEYCLASKTGIIVDGDKRRIDCRPETIRAALETSLKLLRTDHIDLYYLHRPDPSTPIEESVGELARLVEEGKIGGYGLSEMSAATLRRAAAVHPVTALQTEYSPWTPRSRCSKPAGNWARPLSPFRPWAGARWHAASGIPRSCPKVIFASPCRVFPRTTGRATPA